MAVVTMVDANRRALFEEMEGDPSVVALGEDSSEIITGEGKVRPPIASPTKNSEYPYRKIKENILEGDYTEPIGKAVVRRKGRDLTIISYAAMAHTSLEAAEQLAKEGVETEVIDLRTLLPLDRETILASIRKTNKLLIVHEDTRTGGIAGEIAAIVCEGAFEDLDRPIMGVTALDTPVPLSPPLEERFLPNAKKVVTAARILAQ